MQNHKDDIGDLFSKTFENHQTMPEKDEWEMLNASLQNRNFFRFNAQQFNIYYASTIVFCFFVCLGVGSHYTYEKFFKPQFQQEMSLESETKQNTLVNQSESITDQASNSTSIKSELKDVEKESIDTLSSNIQHESKVSEKQTVKSVENELNKKDSVVKVSHLQLAESIKKDTSKAKQKRVLYITKQDTIVKFDTLHAPKQKKKWFK